MLKRHPEIRKAKLVVENPDGEDRMRLVCEVDEGANALKEAIVASLRNVTKLRGEAVFSRHGRLPNDGRVIEDLRQYE